jgi:Flp pilus assembly protein TadG
VVELTFCLLFFLMLGFGVVEFGRAFQAQIVVIQAAREGARVGSDGLISTATIQAAVVSAARPYTIQTSNITVSYPTGQVRVTAIYHFTSDIWFVPDIDITGSVVGRRL